MVLAFAQAGADVVIASRKQASCDAGGRRGHRARPVEPSDGPATSVDWDDVEALVDAAYAEFGRVDVLVNNAGMSPLYPSLVEVNEDLFDKVVAVNLKGPFRLTALVGARMVAGQGGSIINVSSVAAIRPAPEDLPYAASKAGARRPHRRLRARLWAESPGQHDHGRPLHDRHLPGVGSRRVRPARQSLSARPGRRTW